MSIPALRLSRPWRLPICSSCLRQTAAGGLRFSSSDAAPALLAKMKDDLKKARLAKDTARLTVLRSIIAETNQVASGPNPIKTDLQVLAMLKKRKAASQTAAKEFADHDRSELSEKENAQIAVLDEYVGSVQLMSKDEMTIIVNEVVAGIPEDGRKQPRVMKELLQPGGRLEGKPIEKAELAKVVQEVLAGK